MTSTLTRIEINYNMFVSRMSLNKYRLTEVWKIGSLLLASQQVRKQSTNNGWLGKGKMRSNGATRLHTDMLLQ